MGLLTGVGRGLSELIYPPLCWICEREVLHCESAVLLCDRCDSELWPIPKERCPGCSKINLKKTGARSFCHECQTGVRRFDRAICVYLYAGTFRTLWHRIKFSGQVEFLPRVVEQAIGCLSAEDDFNPYLFDMYTWVPTTDKRKSVRGYDTAEEIVRYLAKKYNRPFQQLLFRTRDCPPQFELGRQDRLKNVEGAFTAMVPSGVRLRSVLLVDDILTTGATASACAAALKLRGFQKVVLWTLARGT